MALDWKQIDPHGLRGRTDRYIYLKAEGTPAMIEGTGYDGLMPFWVYRVWNGSELIGLTNDLEEAKRIGESAA